MKVQYQFCYSIVLITLACTAHFVDSSQTWCECSIPNYKKKYFELTQLAYFSVTIPSTSPDFTRLGNMSSEQLPN